MSPRLQARKPHEAEAMQAKVLIEDEARRIAVNVAIRESFG